MRLLLLFTLTLLLSFHAQAQDKREIGLRATGINNVGFILKKERSADRFMRYRLGFANLRLTTGNGNAIIGANLGAAIGWERRRRLADRLELLHGWEPFASVNFSGSNNVNSTRFSGGVGYVLGVQYSLSERFHLALETTPSVSASLNVARGTAFLNVAAGFSSGSVALTGVYRFNK